MSGALNVMILEYDYIRRQGNERKIKLLPVAGARVLAGCFDCYRIHLVLHGSGSAGQGEYY